MRWIALMVSAGSLTCHFASAEFLVSDFNDNVVRRYDETSGAFIDVFVTNTNGMLNLPHGLAFGPDHNLYVASAGNDRVLRYNGTNGAFLDVFVADTAGLDYPVRLIFRPDGRLYVSSQLNDRVLRFDATNGHFVDVFVTNSLALDGPSDMTFGPDGNLYVVGRFNNRVVRYHGQTGAFLDVVAGDNLSQPFGLRFGLTNDLLVVSGNDNRIQRFHGGAFLGPFALEGGLGLPVGIVHGPDANLYVASYNTHRIARYDAVSGAYLGDFVPAGSGGLSGPNFMVFRPPVGPAPTLSFTRTAEDGVISWPARSIPAVLEQAETLSNISWQQVTDAISVISSANTVTVSIGAGAAFFRLRLLE